MKRILLLLASIILLLEKCPAQSFAEWFKQKKTAQSYLLQQIAALKIYTHAAKEGYRLVSGGLQTWKNIKNGDMKLHEIFFASLKTFNPALAGPVSALGTDQLLEGIQRQALLLTGELNGSELLQDREKAYFNSVIKRRCQAAIKAQHTISALSTGGGIDLSDSERLQRIAGCRETLLQSYLFIKAFANQLRVLLRSRARERLEIKNQQRFLTPNQ